MLAAGGTDGLTRLASMESFKWPAGEVCVGLHSR
jgi:hypothetical protein